MSKEQTDPGAAVLRVCGSATVAVACDTVEVTVSFARAGATVVRASSALRRALARFDRVLIAHAHQVASAHQLPVTHLLEEQVTAAVQVVVSAHNGPGLSEFLTAVRAAKPSTVSEVRWLLSATNPVFALVRKAAAEDAVDAARVHARGLRTELVELVWLVADQVPARLDQNEPQARVHAEARVQFTIRPVAVGSNTGT